MPVLTSRSKGALLLGNEGMEGDLQQQVPQLLAKGVVVLPLQASSTS